MILADTSVWIGHFRHNNRELARLLDAGMLLCHPFVIGEVALGGAKQRDRLVAELLRLPPSPVASSPEILEFIRARTLFCRGVGYVDTHLLASVAMVPGTALWTFDKRLRHVAEEMGIAKTN